MKFKHIIPLIIVCLANAALKIDPSLTVLSDTKKMAQITVVNDSDKKAYAKMETTEIYCRDKSKINCKDIQEIANENSKKIKFSSPKFILQPKQSKSLYVMWQEEMPEDNHMFYLAARDMAESANSVIHPSAGLDKKMNIKLVVLYKSKILVLKKGATITSPAIDENNNRLTVINKGSAILRVQVKQQCANKDKCQPEKALNTIRKFLKPQEKYERKISENGYTDKVSYYNYNNNEWINVN